MTSEAVMPLHPLLSESHMTEYIHHYTYKIINKLTGQYYIGRRSCNKSPTEDIGVCYFSSSSNKEFIKLQKTQSHLFEYQILKVFDNKHAMILSEILLHAIWQVKDDPLSINKVNATDSKFDCTGLKWTLAKRLAHSKRHTGKRLSEQHKINIGKSNKGLTREDITCERISRANKGKAKPDHVRQVLRDNNESLTKLRKQGWYKVTRIHDRKLMCVGKYQQWLMGLQGYYSVTRISDRKQMDLCQFMNWYNASLRVKPEQIQVTRVKDKKLMNMRQFKQWINSIARNARKGYITVT